MAWVPVVAWPLMIGAGLLLQPTMQRQSQMSQEDSQAKQAVLVETLAAWRSIKALGAGAVMRRRWQDAGGAPGAAGPADAPARHVGGELVEPGVHGVAGGRGHGRRVPGGGRQARLRRGGGRLDPVRPCDPAAGAAVAAAGAPEPVAGELRGAEQDHGAAARARGRPGAAGARPAARLDRAARRVLQLPRPDDADPGQGARCASNPASAWRSSAASARARRRW